MKQLSTSQVYSNPSIFRGVARSVDFWGTLGNVNTNQTESEADYYSIKRDWNVVGQFIKESMLQYAKRNRKAK